MTPEKPPDGPGLPPAARPRSQHYQLGAWRVEVSSRPGVDRLLPSVELARVIVRAVEVAGAPSPAAVGLILSGDDEVSGLNESRMGVKGTTDVLSFPLLPPSTFPRHEGQAVTTVVTETGPAFVLPPGADVHLGEIVVSVERAIEQATAGRGGQTGDVRWSPADELRLLVTHGALHLCGWDHANPGEQSAMRELERRLLELG